MSVAGLRRGEALVLRWEDVDLERGHLQVRAALQRVGGQLVRDPTPKTKASRRFLLAPARAGRAGGRATDGRAAASGIPATLRSLIAAVAVPPALEAPESWPLRP